MKGVTEYFQEKESDLHHRLELGEINQQKYKSLETEAQEKATASEQERERERNELKELRKQMADIEKSFLSQLRSNEERAEDALVSCVCVCEWGVGCGYDCVYGCEGI